MILTLPDKALGLKAFFDKNLQTKKPLILLAFNSIINNLK